MDIEYSTKGQHARRLLIIGLDGWEVGYGERLMAEGELPALSALRERSAVFRLDHGSAQRTGLAWEHFASGLSPPDGGRWSAVEFDPASYSVWQEGARFVPFFGELGASVTVFDAPYVDLRRAAGMQGIVGWGAHDPGTASQGRPERLARSFESRFGPYPASSWTYATPAYCAESCEAMGRALAEAVDRRLDAALWVLEQIPETEAFWVVTGELHSAIEGLWHGVDPSHPLHGHASAPAAAAALRAVHRAVDRFVAGLVEAVPGASILAFAMGGMGSNRSDLQSMVLLPELLYRDRFGRPLLEVPREWVEAQDEVLRLEGFRGWSNSLQWYPSLEAVRQRERSMRSMGARMSRPLRRLWRHWSSPEPPSTPFRSSLGWQPTTHYAERWPEMAAFALPSFYDGRIRVNLRGRERRGVVEPSDYEGVVERLKALIGECADPQNGAPAVARFERPASADPFELDRSDADLTVVWRSSANALSHPEHGLIGPLPYRRTGGHTGPQGVAYLSDTSVNAGDHGVRSSFDVAPTVVELLGLAARRPLSGNSFLSAARKSAQP